MPNVEIFRESPLSADDVLAVGADHVVLATGARWRPDRFDGEVYVPVAEGAALAQVFTPDDIMEGRLPEGPTLVYDEDGYYMAGAIAERLRAAGLPVTYATPSDSVASWGEVTVEAARVRKRLVALGVDLALSRSLASFEGSAATLDCVYGGGALRLAVSSVVMVTARAPDDDLYHALLARAGSGPLPFTLRRIGDCEAPSIIAAAVHAGHLYARTLDAPEDPDHPLRHERIDVAADVVPVLSRAKP
jgi:dimethylamine/trimethylamine dehydrogenase